MRFLSSGHKSAACTRMNLSLPSIIRSLFHSFCPSRLLIYSIAMHCRPFTKSSQDIDIDFLRFSRDAHECGICARHPSSQRASRDLNCSGWSRSRKLLFFLGCIGIVHSKPVIWYKALEKRKICVCGHDKKYRESAMKARTIDNNGSLREFVSLTSSRCDSGDERLKKIFWNAI